MRLFLCLLFLLLSGCWTGEKLYSASDAVAAIPPGKYYDDLATRSHTGRVSIDPNGMTRLVPDDDTEKTTLIGFVPLDGEGHKYAIWLSDDVDGQPIDAAGIYGLLLRSGDQYSMFMPACSETSELAVAAGAKVEKGMVDECRFPNRASLEKALKAWQPKPDQAMARLHRIGD